MENYQRLIWADVLRIVSIFAVILIHSAAPFLVRYNQLDESTWWIGNVYDSLSRWCVPVFIMVSGSLVLGKSEDSFLWFFTQRLRKVLVPLLIWSGIYLGWETYSDGHALEWTNLFPRVFVKPVYYHLWFLYVILGLYVLVPVLRLGLNHFSTRATWLIVGLWVALSFVPPAVAYFAAIDLWQVNLNNWTGIAKSTIALSGYFVLGFLLQDVRLTPRYTVLACALFLIGFGVTAWGTYRLTLQHQGEFQGIFYEYFSFNVLLMSATVFLVTKSLAAGTYGGITRKERILQEMSADVLGIYLIHAMVLEALRDGMLGWQFEPLQVHAALGIPLFAALIFFLSFSAIWVLRRIPLVRPIAP
ncbi:acyltransferase [Legionella clemsonensis]|uniref:Inner membrane protein YiaH n=1 Tax=Legionella clemsonensis TaxID=1867846 RepID=A0A222NZZ7_9GAMM|nr:acyltransferase family protein [Legionella clemsonensis]ASQ45174.1 Inner membrane protein YiaH [Legionella clemsonensis]